MELSYYQTSAGERPFVDWLEGLTDRQARTRIEARLARVAVGNLGDVEPVGEGVLLLCGGDKRTQQRDITRAKGYFEDYKTRTAQKKPRGRR